MAAIAFTTGDRFLRHAALANQWQEVTMPGDLRVFTVYNESSTDNALVAEITVAGDGGAINVADNYVTIPPLASLRLELHHGGASREGVPSVMFVGAAAANTPQLALENSRG